MKIKIINIDYAMKIISCATFNITLLNSLYDEYKLNSLYLLIWSNVFLFSCIFYELISYNEKWTTLQSLIKKWVKDYKNLFYTFLFYHLKSLTLHLVQLQFHYMKLLYYQQCFLIYINSTCLYTRIPNIVFFANTIFYSISYSHQHKSLFLLWFEFKVLPSNLHS